MAVLVKPHATNHIHLNVWIQFIHPCSITHFCLNTHFLGHNRHLGFLLQPLLGLAEHHKAILN